jgi:hypothetical protein
MHYKIGNARKKLIMQRQFVLCIHGKTDDRNTELLPKIRTGSLGKN